MSRNAPVTSHVTLSRRSFSSSRLLSEVDVLCLRILCRDLTMNSAATTPRRSKRFQPFVASNTDISSEASFSWVGEPLHQRPTLAEDLQDEDNFEEDAVAHTSFYRTIERATKSAPQTSGKGKAKASADDTEQFSLGDTVLIRTQTKQPSVAVIVSMWEVEYDCDDDSGMEVTVPFKVKLHWFLRPTELPNVRARKTHLKVARHTHICYRSAHMSFNRSERNLLLSCSICGAHSTRRLRPLQYHFESRYTSLNEAGFIKTETRIKNGDRIPLLHASFRLSTRTLL